MDDLAAIAALRRAYFAAYEAGDATAIPDFVSDDTILNTPTGSVRGKADIGAHYARMFAGMRVRFEDFSDETDASGDLGFCRGRYKLSLTLDGAAPVERAGRYLVIFKRNPASRYGWSVHREVVQPLAMDELG
jgi:ketosteroid isomerase-like protein